MNQIQLMRSASLTIYLKAFIYLFTLSLLPSAPVHASMQIDSTPLDRGFAPIPIISNYNIGQYTISKSHEQGIIAKFCSNLKKAFAKYNWHDDPCGRVKWRASLKSKNGFPLIYAEFGQGKETTLFLGGVHPDELTPINLAFRFARYLEKHPKVYTTRGFKVIVAPLANPDGFLLNRPLRTNGRVDINRNFFTLDWYERAIDRWRRSARGQARYFPGYFPNSEIETNFQVTLLDIFQPDKVFSVHAPLGFLDYDGPGDQKPRHLSRIERKAKQFVHSVSKKTHNYKIVDYSFFPGSLGNFAGNERNLPTITLELETTMPSKVEHHWNKFLPGFKQSVQYPFRQHRNKLHENASRFFSGYFMPETLINKS